jgi:geranylgeranyl pyrophosphate synthase
MNLAIAVELIHNATLIHDDIIDNATKRRGKVSLNIKLGNNLSVLAGDFLLSIAMKKLNECNNQELIKIFSIALSNMCLGEINQQFSLNKIPSIDEYILKSQNKTAELFIASLKSLAILLGIRQQNEIYEFARNYGIAFQLKDDLVNILQTDLSKPDLSDIYNGNYTLPVIYFAQENNCVEEMSKTELVNKIVKNSLIIDKTNGLIKDYSTRAIASLDFIEDNQYKLKLKELTESLYKAE